MTDGATYLLDTTVLVDVSRQVEPTAAWLRDVLRSPDVVGVSGVNVAEFFAGLRPNDRARWEGFFGDLEYWAVTPEIAMRAGIFRYDYARHGRAILLPDALVAATAEVVGAILVTSNAKDFPMPGIRILRVGT